MVTKNVQIGAMWRVNLHNRPLTGCRTVVRMRWTFVFDMQA